MKNFYYKKYQQIITIVSKHVDPVFSDDRQLAIKEKILAEIRRTPQVAETQSATGRINWQDWGLRSVRFALVTIIVVAVGTGTAYAAESAQPGDLLYPVKLLNESAELKISIRDEAKAEQLAKIAERRLDENLELQVYTVEIPQQQSDNAGEPAIAGNFEAPKLARKLSTEQAKTEAAKSEQRFNQAMESLKQTQSKLEQKGNLKAAEAVKANIQRIQEKSQRLVPANNSNSRKQ